MATPSISINELAASSRELDPYTSYHLKLSNFFTLSATSLSFASYLLACNFTCSSGGGIGNCLHGLDSDIPTASPFTPMPTWNVIHQFFNLNLYYFHYFHVQLFQQHHHLEECWAQSNLKTKERTFSIEKTL